MKVLWFFNQRKTNHLQNRAKRLHYDFILKLKKHVELYQREPIKIKKAISDINPDLILIYSYHSIKKCIPNIGDALADIRIPKLCIEVDYYSADKAWCLRNGFIIVNRAHIPDSPEPWLPFSCHEEFIKFQNRSLADRKHEIAFTGSYRTGRRILWKTRGNAISILSKANLIKVNGSNGVVGHKKYPRSIAKSFCALSCSGYLVNSPFGKVFEIMGSGTLLFTTPLHASKILFNSDSFFYKYQKDCANIISVANNLLSDPISIQQELVDIAADKINTAHTDAHRINDLLEIMEAIIKNRKVPRKWIP